MSRVHEALKLAGQMRRPEAVQTASAPHAFEEFPAEVGPGSELDEGRGAGELVQMREFSGGVVPLPRPSNAPDVTHLSPETEGKIVIDGVVSPVAIEQYRRLATSLLLMAAQSELRTLMISSALPREGKTLTSTNLALLLARSYKRKVLLIDGDLRRPSLHGLFGLSNSVGLADVLRSSNGSSAAYVEVLPHLTIVPAGSIDQTAMAGLTSERMRTFLADGRKRFEWVIVDTPPVGLVSDSNILASLVDGVVLVIGARSTPFAAVQQAVSAFGRERIVGVVLNRVVSGTGRRERYFSEYYSRPGKETTGP